MPWCPKCKNEFQEGYTICSDCKVELVEELPVMEEFIPFFQSESKKIAEKLAKYFSYSNLKSVIRFSDELEVYIVYVPSDLRNVAQKLYQAFYFVERERHENGLDDEETTEAEEMTEAEEGLLNEEALEADTEEADDLLPDTEALEDDSTLTSELFKDGKALYRDTWNEKAPVEEEVEEEVVEIVPVSYVMKAEKYKDYTATVGVFLGIGILGIVFVVLNIAGVLTILNGILPISVMGALFIFFIIVGISSLKKAKELRLQIADEKKMTDQINDWLKTNVTAEYLESLSDETVSAEVNYIRVTDIIKKRLQENFPDQNSDYLDRLIEEFYNENFDTEVI